MNTNKGLIWAIFNKKQNYFKEIKCKHFATELEKYFRFLMKKSLNNLKKLIKKNIGIWGSIEIELTLFNEEVIYLIQNG